MYRLVSLILHAFSFLFLAEMIQKNIKHWSWRDSTYTTLNQGRSWHWNVQKTSLPGDNLKMRSIIQKDWQKNLLIDCDMAIFIINIITYSSRSFTGGMWMKIWAASRNRKHNLPNWELHEGRQILKKQLKNCCLNKS